MRVYRIARHALAAYGFTSCLRRRPLYGAISSCFFVHLIFDIHVRILAGVLTRNKPEVHLHYKRLLNGGNTENWWVLRTFSAKRWVVGLINGIGKTKRHQFDNDFRSVNESTLKGHLKSRLVTSLLSLKDGFSFNKINSKRGETATERDNTHRVHTNA